ASGRSPTSTSWSSCGPPSPPHDHGHRATDHPRGGNPMSQRDLSQPAPSADASPPAPAPRPGKDGERVPLSRSLKQLETVALTVAAVAPTAGVFIIIPVALVATGTGTFYTFLLGAVIAVCVGFCYAE